MGKGLFLNERKIANVEEMLMAQSVPQGWRSQACLQHWNHPGALKSKVTSVPPQNPDVVGLGEAWSGTAKRSPGGCHVPPRLGTAALGHWSLNSGPWTSSINSTWDLVINAKSDILPQT